MYQYIPREELRSVLDISDFPESGRAEIAYRCFVNDNQEALYIEENGVLLGMVSIGDLERYYGDKKERLEINSRFAHADRIDENKAAAFFESFKTFFEFPVVNDSGRLEGVLRREPRYDIRQDQLSSLVVSKYLRERWHRRELSRFLKNTKARVVLYYTEEAAVLRGLADRRAGLERDGEEGFWKGLSKEAWTDFLGEPDAAETLKKEFGNFHTEMVKGVSEVVDMAGEFYHCTGGNRVTTGNPENPEWRVVFYGPCTVVGAYGRDGQTIASCLQGIMNLRTDLRIQVVNRGLFNMTNLFSRMMTDELSGKDIAVIYVEKGWLTEEICGKCAYVGSLTDTFLSIENLENYILDSPEHCNYKVNQRLAERIYSDLEERRLLETKALSGRTKRIQDYYIGSEIMSEVLRYMERYGLLREAAAGARGAMTLFADPFTDRHRRAVEAALQRVDALYLFLSEDSNLTYTLEERIRMAKEALGDLGKRITVVPAGKYLFTKKISRGIRKQRFCDADMEYDCDVFGELFGGFLGIKYRFVMSEMDNPVERSYRDICMDILPRFGVAVEELQENTGKAGIGGNGIC